MLKIDKVSKSAGELEIIKEFSLTLKQGEIAALIGPSGCGKSTLLNLISGLQSPDSGSISGNDCRLSYMFQDSRLLPWRSVYRNIELATEDKDRAKIECLIRKVGLEGFESYTPEELSGGMAKRCALARAFARGGDYFLMDEPFSALDYGLRSSMGRLLLEIWREEKPGVLFVTHEIDEALTLASRIILVSARPMSVVREIPLPAAEGRDPSSASLLSIRKEIVRHITVSFNMLD